MLFKQIILITILSLGLTASAQKQKVRSLGSKDGFEISIHATNLKDKKLQLYLISGVTKKQFITDSLFIENDQLRMPLRQFI